MDGFEACKLIKKYYTEDMLDIFKINNIKKDSEKNIGQFISD